MVDPSTTLRHLRGFLDRTTLLVLTTRLWSGLSGPVTVIVLSRTMPPEVQGYYYTFANLMGLQTFVELGLFQVLLNMGSHEWARLSLDGRGEVVGAPDARSRLASLGRFAFGWFGGAAVLFVVMAGVIGWRLFASSADAGVAWKGPWMALLLLTALQGWAMPFHTLLEACGQVEPLQKVRFAQAILSSLVFWLALVAGWGLWATIASGAVILLRDVYLLGGRFRTFRRLFLSNLPGERISWRREILPWQWKLAVLGPSTYLSFGMFTPLLFHFRGAVEAGRLGMSMQLVNLVLTLAGSWFVTTLPTLGLLAARGEQGTMERTWLRMTLASTCFAVLAGIGGTGLIYLLPSIWPVLAERMVGVGTAAIFFAATATYQLSACLVYFGRAFKREIAFGVSAVQGFLILAAAWPLAQAFGVTGLALAYLGVCALFILPLNAYFAWRFRMRLPRPDGAT